MKRQIQTLDEFINQNPKNRQMENYTEKLKTEILNESKSKLVERFREYLEGLGFNPMNVWSNEFGLFAQLKEYLKKPDNFSQIYGSEPKMGTIVRLSYNDIGNEKIVGDFVFEKNISKRFKINPEIGKTKYSISFYDGIKTHKDGSPFYDLEIFKSKKELYDAIEDFKSDGYIEENYNLNINEKSYADIMSTISDEDYQKLMSSKEYKKAYNDYLDGDKKPSPKERQAATHWAVLYAYSELFESNDENKQIDEKLAWVKYLKELGIDSKKFKKEFPNEFAYFKEGYLKSSEASEFEQNHYDDLLRIASGLTESLDKIEKSKRFEIGDIFTIDWDGKSTVMITDKDNKDLTINRLDKKNNPMYDEENQYILSYSDFSNMIISYAK